jgi:hypothetical protein
VSREQELAAAITHAELAILVTSVGHYVLIGKCLGQRECPRCEVLLFRLGPDIDVVERA